MDPELKNLLKTFLKANAAGMAGINVLGNRQILTYFTGVTAENPSGSVDNVQRIEYYDSSRLILTEEYSYNTRDNIIEIRTL